MGRGYESPGSDTFFLQCRISEWTLMLISENFRYRNDVFQSDVFVSNIGITYVDVGYHWHSDRCRCPPMIVNESWQDDGLSLSPTSHHVLWIRDFLQDLDTGQKCANTVFKSHKNIIFTTEKVRMVIRNVSVFILKKKNYVNLLSTPPPFSPA